MAKKSAEQPAAENNGRERGSRRGAQSMGKNGQRGTAQYWSGFQLLLNRYLGENPKQTIDATNLQTFIAWGAGQRGQTAQYYNGFNLMMNQFMRANPKRTMENTTLQDFILWGSSYSKIPDRTTRAERKTRETNARGKTRETNARGKTRETNARGRNAKPAVKSAAAGS